jgi:hypothetical protein
MSTPWREKNSFKEVPRKSGSLSLTIYVMPCSLEILSKKKKKIELQQLELKKNLCCFSIIELLLIFESVAP